MLVRPGPSRRTDCGRSSRNLQDKEPSKFKDTSYPNLSEYSFNISLVELVAAMRNIKEAKFSKPIRRDTNQRDASFWCEFHATHGHKTGECSHLREEVAVLLKNGHLREFLSDRAKNNYWKGCYITKLEKPIGSL